MAASPTTAHETCVFFLSTKRSHVTCGKCGTAGPPQDEAASDITVNIDNLGVSTVEGALRAYTQEESIEYRCDVCAPTHSSRKGEASKKVALKHVGEVRRAP